MGLGENCCRSVLKTNGCKPKMNNFAIVKEQDQRRKIDGSKSGFIQFNRDIKKIRKRNDITFAAHHIVT